ncbi:hypothetical protein MTR_4g021400 [Medicago truncatula]|uniref:Uncharacterized protein n=1 Tax=Medicago truncatula TaxID=3880 RepID=G7JTE9_MEDTR|nr:hypothetical protein MTR_4g021400 [Medicago truncatula]
MNKPLFLNPKVGTKQDAIKYAEIVDTILRQHEGNFISCCFKHFPESLDLGDVKAWVEFVLKREKLSYLSLECSVCTWFIRVNDELTKDEIEYEVEE